MLIQKNKITGIGLAILICVSGFGFRECGNSASSTNSNSNSAPKTKAEKIAEFRHQAAVYSHRIQNGILRFVEFKRELKAKGKFTAAQDLALNETLEKLSDSVDNLNKLITSTDIADLTNAESILNNIDSIAKELTDSIISFSPKESANTILTVSNTIQVAISGLKTLLPVVRREIL